MDCQSCIWPARKLDALGDCESCTTHFEIKMRKCKYCNENLYFDFEARCPVCTVCGKQEVPEWFVNQKEEQERLEFNTHRE